MNLTAQHKGHVYFEGLNGLRFFAALAVIITHVELMKKAFLIENCWSSSVIVFNLGSLGVYFFFVLSGFLITYLLLVEKEKTGTIEIKKFYMRRILRIWPLYYLILVIGFFVLPNFSSININYLTNSFKDNFGTNLILYITMLPNLAFALFPAVPHIGQAWSIGVEEQFYLLWPILVKKTARLLRAFLILIVLLVVFKLVVLLISNSMSNVSWFLSFKRLLAMSKFECMAIGGIGAYCLHKSSSLLFLVSKPFVSTVSLCLVFIILYFMPEGLRDAQHLVISVLFLIIILNVILVRKKWISHKIFDFLGKISYGIYMYHFMIIPVVLVLLTKIINPPSNLPLFNTLLYFLSIALTAFISGISYTFFERRFVKRKEHFAVINSGKPE